MHEIENAKNSYRLLLETHVETVYDDDVSLEMRIQMIEQRLEIPYALRAEMMDSIQTTQTVVLEKIFQEFC